MISLLDATNDPQPVRVMVQETRDVDVHGSRSSPRCSVRPMTPEQLAIYQKCTGREAPPDGVASEAWLVVGRRGGKSFALALIAVFLACFFELSAVPAAR